MKFDVAILAGGYGTRLHGLWQGPKCLALYQGRPIIECIVNLALELQPRKVFLLLGHKASEVVAWREACYPHRDVVPVVETMQLGTIAAIRNALPLLQPPVLFLNGDTVPQYNLQELVKGVPLAAWTKDKYAGVCMLNQYVLQVLEGVEETELGEFLSRTPAIQRLRVPGFIDIGTPEEFLKQQGNAT